MPVLLSPTLLNIACTYRPVDEGSLGGGQCSPQLEIQLKSCPTKTKFALVDFSCFYRSYTNTLVYFKIAMPCFKKKPSIRGSNVNMCMANKVFVVVN